jgi:hypothetical protein
VSNANKGALHTWPEDQPGKKIEPAPIDWTA